MKARPLAKDGTLDTTRAVRMYTVVFVRTADRIAPDTDPRAYFLSRRLGTNNGATLAVPYADQRFARQVERYGTAATARGKSQQ